jgi:hypothetical protein
MDEQRPWHQLFGLSWQDFFHGTRARVELEKDLSQRQQLLDLVIVPAEGEPLPRRPPDGFDDLARHTLVSFKSYQEALDRWTLCEVLGHFVNYRKQVSPTMQELLPEADFRLLAVCVRYPRDLARQVQLETIQEGVYTIRPFTDLLRLVVIHKLPRQPHNAMLHLFSANQDLAEYGALHYRPYSVETSMLLYQLFERYQKEGLPMPLTLEELRRETEKEILAKTPPEKLLQMLSVEQRLEGLPAEQRLEGLSADDMLRALTPEVRAALLRRLKEEEAAAKPE